MIRTLISIIGSLRRDERGQGMVEYGLILALVAVVAIVALGLLGEGVSDIFTNVLNGLTGAGDGN